MERITSLQNAKVKKWAGLHQKKERDKTGTFLIEGEHLLQEAVRENVLDTIITDTQPPFYFENVVYVTGDIMKKLSSSVSGTHWIGVAHKPDTKVNLKGRVLLLDGVQDPGNLGTLIRTAVSFSYDAVYCSKDTVDLYNEKTIRSTQGAFLHIPVIYTDLHQVIESLHAQEFTVYATSLHEAKGMQSITPKEKMAFILGNEGQGVSSGCLKDSDEHLFIEMDGFESLNVAVAGGIVMYHYHI